MFETLYKALFTNLLKQRALYENLQAQSENILGGSLAKHDPPKNKAYVVSLIHLVSLREKIERVKSQVKQKEMLLRAREKETADFEKIVKHGTEDLAALLSQISWP